MRTFIESPGERASREALEDLQARTGRTETVGNGTYSGVACPECGSPLDIVPEGHIYDLRGTTRAFIRDGRLHEGRSFLMPRPAPFAACSGCEFCIEITPLRVRGYNDEAAR